MRLLVFVAFLALLSCKKNDQPLTLTKQPYIGTEFRIDGYYYGEYVDHNGKNQNSILIFYVDGTLLLPAFENSSSLNQIETAILNGECYNQNKDRKLSWGLFKASGGTLTVNHWWHAPNGTLRSILSEVSLLNDTTILAPSGTYMFNTNEYHFKEFDSKPDSLNPFL